MFESLSGETQLILLIAGIAVLFLWVVRNSRRNKEKLYKRRGRTFKDNMRQKRWKREGRQLSEDE